MNDQIIVGGGHTGLASSIMNPPNMSNQNLVQDSNQNNNQNDAVNNNPRNSLGSIRNSLRISLRQQNRIDVRNNFRAQIEEAINESILINALLLFISVNKMIAYLVLGYSNSDEICTGGQLCIWLKLMFLHDTLYSIHLISLLVIIFLHRQRRLMNRLSNPDGIDNEYWQIFYLIIFIQGNLLIFYNEEQYISEYPTHFYLALAFVIMGYFYLGIPLFFFASICLCMPFMLVMYLVLRRRRNGINRGLDEQAISNLPIKSPGEIERQEDDLTLECCICLVEYEQEDEVIILPCNKQQIQFKKRQLYFNHHFHASCIKQWVKINGVCPICKRDLKELVIRMDQISNQEQNQYNQQTQFDAVVQEEDQLNNEAMNNRNNNHLNNTNNHTNSHNNTNNQQQNNYNNQINHNGQNNQHQNESNRNSQNNNQFQLPFRN